MGFTVKLFPDEPILMVTVDSKFNPAERLRDVMAQVIPILDSAQQQLFYVVDLREAKVSFEDTLAGVNAAARGANSYLKHQNMKEVVFVSSDKMVQLSAQGLKSPIFGVQSVALYPTAEDALAYIREKITMSA